ncbi:hypothetical protein WSK_0393 [Novosphingobium sp. Rr 2-17]|uniref:fasciclin domain-containing protein n=1 Tax=Novosphingobium sp. Rr 2-17 TaxID=555793 RepID=UPI00026994B1|nr:fasciclin domain-containing protein [Novosphingobium sp. Rr 2-17]EIZ81001.1 hypothetical protein WSK_0393 [Novosphingobium sp. Rr 2-17]
MRTIRKTLLLTALAGGLALAGCSKKTEEAPSDEASAGLQAIAPGAKSVPDVLENADGLQTVAEALKETGIATVLKGKGSYTLLAPEDDTFDSLGDSGKALTQSDDHAAMAALLKTHMLPGYITPQDIGRAIDASKDGQVSMPNFNGQALTFSRSGQAIVVTAPDGSHAQLDGDPIAGGASIAIPVDGVLRKI